MNVDELYQECNDFTMHTTKVPTTVVLSPAEYVEALGNDSSMPFTFHRKLIFIQLSSYSHILFTVQEWINMGCPKTMEEGRLKGWISTPCL